MLAPPPILARLPSNIETSAITVGLLNNSNQKNCFPPASLSYLFFFLTKDLVQLRSSFSSNMRIQTHSKKRRNKYKKTEEVGSKTFLVVRLHLLPPTYFCGVILFLFSLFFLSFQFLSCISIVFRLQHSSHCFTCVCTS